MDTQIDLLYDPNSFVGPLDEYEIVSFEKWLRASEYKKISFDRSYIDHLSRFHGGVPRKRCFRTALGTEQAIDRFLSSDSNHPLKQYSVEGTWSLLSDRMGKHLMPFAELCFGDYLCFDHEQEGRPRVVMWFHERSRSERPPYTEFVAANFDEFLALLQDEP